jgi:hypothetical protein
MTHRYLGHQRLLDRTTKDGLHAGVSTQFLADVIHDAHDRILVPPGRILDTLDFASHDDDLTGGNELTARIGGPQVIGNTGRRDITVQGLCQPVDKFRPLTRSEDVRRTGSEYKVAIQVHNQGIRGSVE